ncbi:MAG TPA: Uma2 family endonuclease [Thermoanaerobaculia bacterium]|nr:Uma2 family endonuclease [Thermoanaerobaculia bacterium]
MAARIREHATYEDLMKVPDTMVAEIIEGELYTWPRPSYRHSNFASSLGMVIGPPYHRGDGGPGGWWILDEPEIHLGRNILVPDIGGWRRERMPELPDSSKVTLPPDWVCEILSPSTSRVDRSKKMPIYANHGVTFAWLIDPIEQTFEVRRLENGSWLIVATYGGDDKVRAEPFELVEIDLASIWGPPPS